MMEHLDDLGRQARQDAGGRAPSRGWLTQRRLRRRRRRWLTIGCVSLVVLAAAAVGGLGSGRDTARTEAVATTIPLDVTTSTHTATSAVSSTQPADGPMAGSQDAAGDPVESQCGGWPAGIELWPSSIVSTQPVDDVDGDGRLVRRLEVEGYTLEISWPPSPRVDYDLSFVAGEQSGFWMTQTDDQVRVGLDPRQSGNSPAPNTPADLVPGFEFARIEADDPGVLDLAGSCAEFELRLLEDGQLIERVGITVEPLGQTDEVSTDDGRTFTISRGVDVVELGPIVVEQRSVAAVPASGRCDGMLVDLDLRTYRADLPVPQDLTLDDAIASGRLTPVADALRNVPAAPSTETWAVVLPGAPPGATIAQLQDQGFLTLIDATIYEEFVDPETGPTHGPGVAGTYERSIDALKAFFDHPTAATFITAGLVELTVDDDTVAYGVPSGHGRADWITVITTERNDTGWLVTGWTSAGC